MRALSVIQPWAYALLWLGKDAENRDWRSPPSADLVGRRFVIHASKKLPYAEPIPCKGMLGFWTPTDADQERIVAREAAARAIGFDPPTPHVEVDQGDDSCLDRDKRRAKGAADRARARAMFEAAGKPAPAWARRDAASPEVRARAALNAAARAGQVARPAACSVCRGGGRIEGHHDDYSKPLAVRWLCSSCHGREHRRAG